MEGGLPLVSTKTLPVAHALQRDALCPVDVDLCALTSPPDAPDSKLALYRTGASPDRIWEWTPPPPPAPPPTGKLGGLGLKGKAKAQPSGKVGRVAWNPQGAHPVSALHRSNIRMLTPDAHRRHPRGPRLTALVGVFVPLDPLAPLHPHRRAPPPARISPAKHLTPDVPLLAVPLPLA